MVRSFLLVAAAAIVSLFAFLTPPAVAEPPGEFFGEYVESLTVFSEHAQVVENVNAAFSSPYERHVGGSPGAALESVVKPLSNSTAIISSAPERYAN